MMHLEVYLYLHTVPVAADVIFKYLVAVGTAPCKQDKAASIALYAIISISFETNFRDSLGT